MARHQSRRHNEIAARLQIAQSCTRILLLSPYTPDSDVVRYAARLEEEFVGRLTRDMALLDLPKPERVTAPLLVLGAECDGCFTQEEVRATARAYRTEAEIFPNMGHNMMVEPEWEAVAQRINTWLETLPPQHSPSNRKSTLPTVK